MERLAVRRWLRLSRASVAERADLGMSSSSMKGECFGRSKALSVVSNVDEPPALLICLARPLSVSRDTWSRSLLAKRDKYPESCLTSKGFCGRQVACSRVRPEVCCCEVRFNAIGNCSSAILWMLFIGVTCSSDNRLRWAVLIRGFAKVILGFCLVSLTMERKLFSIGTLRPLFVRLTVSGGCEVEDSTGPRTKVATGYRRPRKVGLIQKLWWDRWWQSN